MLLHGCRSDRADRRAGDADWFTRPGVLTVGTRCPVKRVLECGRDRTVILGCDEHDAVCSLDLRLQANHGFRRVLIVILIEHRQIVDTQDLAFELLRRELHERSRQLEIDRAIPVAANDDADFSDGHECPPARSGFGGCRQRAGPTRLCDDRSSAA
jgi:hypothetical protein